MAGETATQYRERQQREARMQSLLVAAEFGFKACEAGFNIEDMREQLKALYEIGLMARAPITGMGV